MLNSRGWPVLFSASVGMALLGCSSETLAPDPIPVDPATATGPAGVLTVKLGAIVNTNAPTAERDERLAQVLTEASTAVATGAAVEIEIIRIDEVSDVEAAVSTLAGRGVTVIAALCDDASVPSIVDAAVDNGMLAITACVTLPTPTLTSSSPMFIDLAGMHDAPAAIAAWSEQLDPRSVATIRSDLIDDVETTCVDVESELAEIDLALGGSITFTELVDDPVAIVETSGPLLSEVDVIVLCALPPSTGDVVAALRQVGLDQPVVVPWFADTQLWPDSVNDVFLISPASRHGDDPAEAVRDLLDAVGPDATAVDVVAADSIAMLSIAAQREGSVGASRLSESMRRMPTDVVSGSLSLVEGGSQTSDRSYRVIGITDGEAEFESLVTPTSEG
ncbi:MAG: ABC transporter substrate-binding protein [Acidimicrobiia bacterium]|nr:ABC transporter substrate-binding protein [Acidimicrobiia bacterium]